MAFIRLLSLMLKYQSVDLLKIIEFLNQQVAIQNIMIRESRKIPTIQEKSLLAPLAHSIRHILRLGSIATIF